MSEATIPLTDVPATATPAPKRALTCVDESMGWSVDGKVVGIKTTMTYSDDGKLCKVVRKTMPAADLKITAFPDFDLVEWVSINKNDGKSYDNALEVPRRKDTK